VVLTLKNDRGCFLANLSQAGDYAADQALYTVEAKSYEPNGYNLYNMAGNVSNGQTLHMIQMLMSTYLQ
jgi:formylglycine-generating enzyme required for sulfatase activity